MKEDSWLIKRTTSDYTIVVTANYIQRQETWSMQCKVNGELIDACLSDEPLAEAGRMIGAAIMEEADLTVTVKEEELAA